MTKHVDPEVNDLRTRVQFPPPPPSQFSTTIHKHAQILIYKGLNNKTAVHIYPSKSIDKQNFWG